MFESFKFLNLLLLFELGKSTLISSHEIIFVRLIKSLKDAAINETLVIWMFFQSSRSHKKYQLWQDTSKIPVSFLVEDFSFLLQLTNK